MKDKPFGVLMMAFTAILWSFGGVLIKLIHWDPMVIVGMRSFFAATTMGLYVKKIKITFSVPVVVGGVCMASTIILFVLANKLTSSANAIMLQYTSPIYIVLFSILFFKKKARLLDFVVVFLVFAGIIFFFIGRINTSNTIGNILACIAGLMFSGVFLVNNIPGAKPEESILLGNGICFLVSLPFIFMHITFEPVQWIYILILGVIQIGFAYILFSIGIRKTTPVTASIIASLEPVLNPIWVFLIVGETPNSLALIGGGIVIITIISYNVIILCRNNCS